MSEALGAIWATVEGWPPLGYTVTTLTTLVLIATAGWRFLRRSRTPWEER